MAVTKSRPHLPVVWSDVGEAVDGGGAAELAQLAQRVLPVHVEDLSGEEECVHRLGAVSVFPLHCPRRNNIVSEASPQLLQLSRHEPHHTAESRVTCHTGTLTMNRSWVGSGYTIRHKKTYYSTANCNNVSHPSMFIILLSRFDLCHCQI